MCSSDNRNILYGTNKTTTVTHFNKNVICQVDLETNTIHNCI